MILQQWLSDTTRAKPLLLDVREPWEYEHCRIEGSMLMPMGEVPQRLGDLDRGAEIVVICHHGIRSYRVGLLLAQSGFGGIYNLQSGVAGWAREVDPAMRTY